MALLPCPGFQDPSMAQYFLPKKGVKNCGATSPNGIGLLGKDEGRSLVRRRGSREGKDTSKYRQLGLGIRF
jgi:hypothetical protein